jgi:hypothetical protein
MTRQTLPWILVLILVVAIFALLLSLPDEHGIGYFMGAVTLTVAAASRALAKS